MTNFKGREYLSTHLDLWIYMLWCVYVKVCLRLLHLAFGSLVVFLVGVA